MNLYFHIMSAILCLLTGCRTTTIHTEEGLASYYADFFHGQKTASGEMYDSATLTGAHRELPFGTIVEVTNLDNQRSVKIKINDRGPFVENRIIDLSKAAAKKLEFIQQGIVPVQLKIVRPVAVRPD